MLCETPSEELNGWIKFAPQQFGNAVSQTYWNGYVGLRNIATRAQTKKKH